MERAEVSRGSPIVGLNLVHVWAPCDDWIRSRADDERYRRARHVAAQLAEEGCAQDGVTDLIQPYDQHALQARQVQLGRITASGTPPIKNVTDTTCADRGR